MAITNKRGRMTSAQSDYKRSQGKDLFVKGFAPANIAEIIGVSVKTVSNWRDLYDWENEKELNTIRPSEIKKMILQYVLDIKDGKSPRYKADDLSKIAAAFDRLNDSRKKAVYTMEALDEFSQFMVTIAGKSTGVKREETLELLQKIRVIFDKYINELLESND